MSECTFRPKINTLTRPITTKSTGRSQAMEQKHYYRQYLSNKIKKEQDDLHNSLKPGSGNLWRN